MRLRFCAGLGVSTMMLVKLLLARFRELLGRKQFVQGFQLPNYSCSLNRDSRVDLSPTNDYEIVERHKKDNSD